MHTTPDTRQPTTRWVYPFAQRDAKAPDTLIGHMAIMAQMKHGFFPLSTNGLTNGSLHYGREVKGALDFDAGFRAIADGEVIAYRLDEDFPRLDYGPEPNQRVMNYSLSFVLLRHWMPLPGEGADDGTYIYSLYTYNRPLRDYRAQGYGYREGALPFWQGERVFVVGERCTDAQIVPPPKDVFGPLPVLYDPWGDPIPPAPPPEPIKPILGRRIREAGNKDAAILGLLPRGTQFTIEGNRTSGWARLKSIHDQRPVTADLSERVSPKAPRGWVWLGDMDSCMNPTDETLDCVVVLDKPHRVKAGDLLGHLGENPSVREAMPLGGGSPRYREPSTALEVFADGSTFPTYLERARARAAALPDAEKTVLTITVQAKAIRRRRPADDLLKRDELLLHPDNETVGPYRRGQRHRIRDRRDMWTTPKDLPPADPRNRRCSPDGEVVSAEAFARLNEAKQKRYPCEVLERLSETWLWCDYKNARLGDTNLVWRDFPLALADATKVTPATATTFTRRELDALPANSKARHGDLQWWWVALTDADGPFGVWVAENGLEGVQWHSPHAWPGFQLVDGTTFTLLESFQRHAVISEFVHPVHEQEFAPAASALGHSDMIVKLEQAIDAAGDRDGKLKPREIGAARGKPHLARALSRMAVRFESHWSANKQRWLDLSPLMNQDWKIECERQWNLCWWNEVASKMPSFPQDPHVYHVHPYGWIDNFSGRHLSRPAITIHGIRQEIRFLQRRDSVPLTVVDYERAARTLQCEVEAIRAIALTETRDTGSFFVPPKIHASGDDPVPSILFERHKFSAFTKHAYDGSHPHISGAAGNYGSYGEQYGKLIEAYDLDPESALKSASWGAFQILGENHALCGFADVHSFVDAMSRSESNQLDALVRLIAAQDSWLKPLKEKNWSSFAEHYNGRSYKKNGYDKKMEENYAKLKRGDI